MTNLLYLLGIPPILFVGTVLFKYLVEKCLDYDDEWWAFPLYMSIGFSIVCAVIFGIVACFSVR